jgi:shikimate dehydrogenase
MLALVGELHPTAQRVGAVTSFVATTMDAGSATGGASVACSECSGKVITPRTSRFFVGAGGWAGYRLCGCVRRRADTYRIRCRRASRSRPRGSVAAATGCRADFGVPDPRGCEIVINATSLGMKTDDPMPVDPDGSNLGASRRHQCAEPTPLCRAAVRVVVLPKMDARCTKGRRCMPCALDSTTS